jgi:uncharacterized membrane protein
MAETKAWAIIAVASCTLLTAAGQLLFKLGLNSLDPTLFGIITNYQLLLGFLLYGIGSVVLVISLKYGELSVLYPILALSFVWVAILSSTVLNEHINALKIVGIGCIILGVSAIGRKNGKKARRK